jgi:hypothetical protein
MTRLRFYAGLGLVTAATLMLQIIETRIVSVTSWYHLAFFVISVAMFGLTIGAVYVYLRSASLTPDRLTYHLTVATLAFALTTALAILVQLTLVTGASPSLVAFTAWLELAICLSVPFFFSGVVVSLALTRSPYPIGRVYGVDLVGAAAGCLGVLALLNVTSGPGAMLWVSVLIALAALSFAGSGLGSIPEPSSFGARLVQRRWVILASLAALAFANELTIYGARPHTVKDRFEHPETLSYDRWNSFSRITVAPSYQGPAAMWAASPRMPERTIEQRWLTIDGSAGTCMYRFDGDLKKMDFLRYDLSNLAYAIPGMKKGAVIGVGGGRDVLSARVFGLENVVGVEINPLFVGLLKEHYADYNTLNKLSGVSFEVDEARSWLARTPQSFDVIQMSLIDTWAATGAGAFTLSENGLYTVEAWSRFLQRLTPQGVFTVSRWYAPGDVNETGRMISLAIATLLQGGSAAPRQHIYVASAGNIATLVMARSPLTPDALAALNGTIDRLGFTTILSPDRPAPSPMLERIVSAPDRAALDAATNGFYLDLTPPTDARPFFFNQLKIGRLFAVSVFSNWQHGGVFGGNLTATVTLAMLIVISALLVALTIILPLRSTVRKAGWRLAGAGTLYFALIGVGFMMAEIALLQRMSVFLGHPVYALSVVLFSLILSTGLGSFLSQIFPLNSTGRLVGWAAATAIYLASLPFWLPPLLFDLDSASLLVRAGFCVLVLAPAGLMMGFGFPTGMRLVSAISQEPTPWFWGINGAAGVLAASVAVLTSITFGIDTTLGIGALCYLLVALPGLALLSPEASAFQGGVAQGAR